MAPRASFRPKSGNWGGIADETRTMTTTSAAASLG